MVDKGYNKDNLGEADNKEVDKEADKGIFFSCFSGQKNPRLLFRERFIFSTVKHQIDPSSGFLSFFLSFVFSPSLLLFSHHFWKKIIKENQLSVTPHQLPHTQAPQIVNEVIFRISKRSDRRRKDSEALGLGQRQAFPLALTRRRP